MILPSIPSIRFFHTLSRSLHILFNHNHPIPFRSRSLHILFIEITSYSIRQSYRIPFHQEYHILFIEITPHSLQSRSLHTLHSTPPHFPQLFSTIPTPIPSSHNHGLLSVLYSHFPLPPSEEYRTDPNFRNVLRLSIGFGFIYFGRSCLLSHNFQV